MASPLQTPLAHEIQRCAAKTVAQMARVAHRKRYTSDAAAFPGQQVRFTGSRVAGSFALSHTISLRK